MTSNPLTDPRVVALVAAVNNLLAPLNVHVYATLAARIRLGLPARTKRGKPMPNFELPNDEVVTITIQTTNSAGTVEPVPTGDVFTVVSSNPTSLGATVGVDASGAPAVVLTPLVQTSPNITITISDSAGLPALTQLVDIVEDVTPSNIILDLADATHVSQPVPTAPGP
jgi:hypothetical protein